MQTLVGLTERFKKYFPPCFQPLIFALKLSSPMNRQRGHAAPAGVSSAHPHSCLQHAAATTGGDRIRPLPSCCRRRDRAPHPTQSKSRTSPGVIPSRGLGRGLIRPWVPALLSSHGGTWRWRPRLAPCRMAADNQAGPSIAPHSRGLCCASRGPAPPPSSTPALAWGAVGAAPPPSREPPGHRPPGTGPGGGPHSQQCQCQVLP